MFSSGMELQLEGEIKAGYPRTFSHLSQICNPECTRSTIPALRHPQGEWNMPVVAVARVRCVTASTCDKISRVKFPRTHSYLPGTRTRLPTNLPFLSFSVIFQQRQREECTVVGFVAEYRRSTPIQSLSWAGPDCQEWKAIPKSPRRSIFGFQGMAWCSFQLSLWFPIASFL